MDGKTLKFAPNLVPLVLSGEKNSTWRLWDDKDLKVGDVVTFIRRPELTPFATAEITYCLEKTLGELNDDDKKGHETVGTPEEMYARYSQYYKRPVGPDAPIKILRFKIIKKI